jgi:hypothetical protein
MNGKTGCKRRLGFKNDEEEARVMRRLRWWAIMVKDCKSRVEHIELEFPDCDIKDAQFADPPQVEGGASESD